MIGALVLLLGLQLAGEAVARATGLPIPGPVIGMAAALVLFAAAPPAREAARPAAEAILGKLGLLFVPAGVGVVGHLGRLGWDALWLGLALVLSTAAAIAAGAWAFALVARALGTEEAE